MICFHSLLAHAFLIVDNSQVKLSCRVVLLDDRQFEVVNRLVMVLLVLEVEHAQVEVSFKVLRVNLDRLLVEGQNFVDDARVALCCGLQTLGLAVDRVYVLRVKSQDF